VTPVRVGIVGAGFIARFHQFLLEQSNAALAIVAVHDLDRERATALADACGAAAVASVEELCEQVDAVFVCTWTAAHHEVVEVAVRHGCAVYCEKPLAPDLEQARALVDTVRTAGVVNQVGLVLRRSPALVLAKRLLADPGAGRPMAAVLRDDQFIPIQGMYASDWRADPGRAGAGTVIEHSIHDVDLLEWMLGPIRQVSAWSREFHRIDGIEDAATAAIEFASGAIGSLVSVWHDVLERPSLRHVELLCERLHVAVEGDWFGPVRWTLSGEPERVLEGEELLAFLAPPLVDDGNPDSAFIAAVAEGRPATPDVTDALRAHEVVDAIYRSAAADGSPSLLP
jgi:predicted dehydrogenase